MNSLAWWRSLRSKVLPGATPSRIAAHALWAALGTLVSLAQAPSQARAEMGAVPGIIAISPDFTTVLKLPSGTSAVVLGNPAVADIVVASNGSAIVTGKSVGVTNLIIQDAQGDILASAVIRVEGGAENHVSLHRGSAREVLVCTPHCEALASREKAVAAPQLSAEDRKK